MKKFSIVIALILTTLCLTGCGKNSIEDLNENIKKMELTGNLVTYKAYYHNVIEYEKEKTGHLQVSGFLCCFQYFFIDFLCFFLEIIVIHAKLTLIII